jgi:hypothetical protein
MLGGIRQRLTFANVMSTIAVFCALGGGAYAAVALPKNSVGSKQIKKNAVTNAKIGNNAVTGAKVKNGSLTGSDINLATLPKVGSAATADNAGHATNADNATNATNATNAANATNATNAGHATNADNIAAPEDWHVVGAAGEPSFSPGASNIPSSTPAFDFPTAAFFKDKEGIVHLRGYVNSGTTGIIFVLPPGYRPADRKIAIMNAYCGSGCTTTDSAANTDTSNSEAVVAIGGGVGSGLDGALVANMGADEWVALDGLTFRAGT